jgi:hypothetical protein
MVSNFVLCQGSQALQRNNVGMVSQRRYQTCTSVHKSVITTMPIGVSAQSVLDTPGFFWPTGTFD